MALYRPMETAFLYISDRGRESNINFATSARGILPGESLLKKESISILTGLPVQIAHWYITLVGCITCVCNVTWQLAIR